jgi:hypothetical protein
MDPNETLAQIRADIATSDSEAGRLGDLVEALDGWLSKGGFPPTAWQPPVPALTGNDHILTRAGADLDDPYGLPWVFGVHLQLCPQTPVFVRLHRRDHRAVVNLGVIRNEVSLYVTTDQVDRLANLFAVIRTRLRH